MTTIEQLTKELNELNANRKAVKEANTVECNAPTANRSYTYRKSAAIKATDVGSL